MAQPDLSVRSVPRESRNRLKRAGSRFNGRSDEPAVWFEVSRRLLSTPSDNRWRLMSLWWHFGVVSQDGH